MNIPYVFKRCPKCREWLVANNINFYKMKSGKWGLESQCKECRKSKQKEKYNNNEFKEEKRKRQRDKYHNDDKFREDFLIKNRKRQRDKYHNDDKFREKINKNNRERYRDKYHNDDEFREKNKERVRKYSKEKRVNDNEWREEKNKKCKEWYKNNPEKAFNNRNKRRSKEENQGNGINEEQWLEMMKFFNWKCAYSGEKMENNKTSNGRTIDHIVALDNGGENEPWNCIPMKKGYNTSKSTKNMLEWYLQQEYFDIDRLTKIYEWRIYAYEKWGRNK